MGTAALVLGRRTAPSGTSARRCHGTIRNECGRLRSQPVFATGSVARGCAPARPRLACARSRCHPRSGGCSGSRCGQPARHVPEIGTLGGYSAIHLARPLPADGRLITLELDERNAAVARVNLAAAGLADGAEVRVGAAIASLPALADEAPFDLAFIDANKDGYPAYLEWCMRLVRPGGMIVVDNVLSRRGVMPTEATDAEGRGIAALNEAAAHAPRLDAIIVPARDGRAGLLLAVVRVDG